MIKTRPKINPLSHQEANLRIPHQKRSNRAKAINKPRAPYLSPRKPSPKIARKLYEIAPHTHLEISIRGARSRSEQEQKKKPEAVLRRSIDGWIGWFSLDFWRFSERGIWFWGEEENETFRFPGVSGAFWAFWDGILSSGWGGGIYSFLFPGVTCTTRVSLPATWGPPHQTRHIFTVDLDWTVRIDATSPETLVTAHLTIFSAYIYTLL